MKPNVDPSCGTPARIVHGERGAIEIFKKTLNLNCFVNSSAFLKLNQIRLLVFKIYKRVYIVVEFKQARIKSFRDRDRLKTMKEDSKMFASRIDNLDFGIRIVN